MDKRYEFVKKAAFYLLFFILLIFALVQSQKFLATFLLAVLFSYLLFPVSSFFENLKVPRILSNLIAILFGILVLTGVVYFFSGQLTVFTDNFPVIRRQALENIEKVQEWVSGTFGVANKELDAFVRESVTNIFDLSGNFLKSIFTATTSTLVRIGLMPVFVFFMLYYRNKTKEFILQIVSRDKHQQTSEIIHQLNKVTRQYITGIFIVVVILSVLHSIALGIIGLKYPILLGVIAALFNFIPYFGTLIGAIVPLLFSMLTMDSLSYFAWVIVYFVIIQFIENNILTPNITGINVRLNPFITILSLIFGSMIWGVIGMFLAIPYMAMIRIVCDNISYLKPIGFLLSDRGTDDHSLTWNKIKRIFRSKR